MSEHEPSPETPEAAGTRPYLSYETAQAAAEQDAAGWEFTLTATTDAEGRPQKALVQKVDLMTGPVFRALPWDLQQRVVQLMDQAREDSPNQTPSAKAAALSRDFDQSEELANAYVIAGFLEPRVYATRAEAEQHGGVWVEWIKVADRRAFMNACQGLGSAASRLAPFRGGPVVDVPAGSVGDPVPGVGQPQPDPAAAVPLAPVGPYAGGD